MTQPVSNHSRAGTWATRSSKAPAQEGVSGPRQPRQPTTQRSAIFSKKGFVPKELSRWARKLLEKKARDNPQMPDSQRASGKRELTTSELLELARKLEAMPKREPFDVLAAIRNGTLTPTTEPKSLDLQQPATPKGDLTAIDDFLRGAPAAPAKPAVAERAPAFEAALPHELQNHYDELRRGTKTPPAHFAEQVRAYAIKTYYPRRQNPFEAQPSDKNVSNLLTYITSGTKRGYARSGHSSVPLNQLGGVAFQSRTEALHHLLYETRFLLEVPPTEANRFMKMYVEYAGKGL